MLVLVSLSANVVNHNLSPIVNIHVFFGKVFAADSLKSG